ncbi:alpha/beta fold hydrolase [Methylobacterium crusticola]|uniref:alpha/beta fold hydrolase n=1 Tax=Methylobacterium crusticola TaxID=1697972 RepID=UPI001EE22C02|nr:alpha/beta fold hydrolase [Methylobacterium crusticola]
MTVTSGRSAGIAYREAGPPDAPALVFLHGIGGAARLWDHQLAAFAGEFRAVAWDMPGYGGSAPLDAVTIAGLAEALAGFLDRLALRATVLVGHSIGGMIVQQILARRPEGLRAAVLAQTSAAFGRPDGAWQQAFIAARLGPLDAGASLPELADGIVAELVGPAADPEGVALARACMAAVPEGTYRATVRALLGFDLRAALPGIAVPTLVLAGSHDTNAPAAVMERMAQRIPGAAYACLPGTGHLANAEQPAAFDAALRGFLSDLDRPGSAADG